MINSITTRKSSTIKSLAVLLILLFLYMQTPVLAFGETGENESFNNIEIDDASLQNILNDLDISPQQFELLNEPTVTVRDAATRLVWDKYDAELHAIRKLRRIVVDSIPASHLWTPWVCRLLRFRCYSEVSVPVLYSSGVGEALQLLSGSV